jgi:hypothetical protein
MSIIYINPYQFAAAAAYDTDAQAYITAVEAADGQSLETAVKDAINDFFVGCKADGIFSALKASCILAGARTLSGALVPLVITMPAPTNYNFVAGDYNRKTGLVGDGSTKYLDSNRAANLDPQNSRHAAVYVSTKTGTGPFLGTASAGPVYTWMGPGASVSNDIYVLNAQIFGVARPASLGFYGTSRPSSTNYSYRFGGSTTTVSSTSAAHGSETIEVYKVDRTVVGFPDVYGASRMSFYSIGESIDLALLDARITTLMSDLAAAIP